MNPRTLYRFAGIAALAAGLLRMISALIPYEPNNAGLEALYAVIDIGLLFGLAGIYLYHAKRTGVIGFIGFVAAAIGIASILGPDPEQFGIDFYYLGVVVISVGLILFAIDLARAGYRVVPALWVAAPAIGAVSFLAGGLVFGLGFAIAGYQLIQSSVQP